MSKANGYKCAVCEFDFEQAYGPTGKECIHVHHLIEISSIGYTVNPAKDLVPLRPNCHYVIHRRRPAFTIEEVQAMLTTKK
jgi:5-methylcytosine-specific restriction protein A